MGPMAEIASCKKSQKLSRILPFHAADKELKGEASPLHLICKEQFLFLPWHSV